MTIKDELDRLDDLYDKTGEDWELIIHHTLTEPTCPTVVINPEGMNAARYRIDCETIEEGIAEAVERVHREVILGQFVEPMAPYTNPDDEKLAVLLAAWGRGEKPEFDDPDQPVFPERLTRAANAAWNVYRAMRPGSPIAHLIWDHLPENGKATFREIARAVGDELGVVIDD